MSNVSTWFQHIIEKNNLTNIFDTGFIYTWDTNVSFDKVDGFVNKTIELMDENKRVVSEFNGDILDIRKLKPGNYSMEITYKLDVPKNYVEFIQRLEKKYNVRLTSREMGILALQATMYEDPKRGKVRKWRETKSTMYLPFNVQIKNVEGDTFYQSKFTTPFSNGLFYQMGINENGVSKKIKIDFEIK